MAAHTQLKGALHLGTCSVEVYALSEQGTYEMAGQYTPGEVAASTVLSGLSLPVGELFVS